MRREPPDSLLLPPALRPATSPTVPRLALRPAEAAILDLTHKADAAGAEERGNMETRQGVGFGKPGSRHS